MKIYSALQIGDYHVNHCEDYLLERLETTKLCAQLWTVGKSQATNTKSLFGIKKQKNP